MLFFRKARGEKYIDWDNILASFSFFLLWAVWRAPFGLLCFLLFGLLALALLSF
jgi:hypothetical protein